MVLLSLRRCASPVHGAFLQLPLGPLSAPGALSARSFSAPPRFPVLAASGVRLAWNSGAGRPSALMAHVLSADVVQQNPLLPVPVHEDVLDVLQGQLKVLNFWAMFLSVSFGGPPGCLLAPGQEETKAC